MEIPISKLMIIIKEEVTAAVLGHWTPDSLKKAMLRNDTPIMPEDMDEATWQTAIDRCLAGEGAYCPRNHGVEKFKPVAIPKRKPTDFVAMLKPASYYKPVCTEKGNPRHADALLGAIMYDHHEGMWDHILFKGIADRISHRLGQLSLLKHLEAGIRAGKGKTWAAAIHQAKQDAFGNAVSHPIRRAAGINIKWFSQISWCARRNAYRRFRKLYKNDWRNTPFNVETGYRLSGGEGGSFEYLKANKRGAWRSKDK